MMHGPQQRNSRTGYLQIRRRWRAYNRTLHLGIGGTDPSTSARNDAALRWRAAATEA
jgi:hypothetical protein